MVVFRGSVSPVVSSTEERVVVVEVVVTGEGG